MSVAAHRLRRLDQVDPTGGGFVPTDISGCIGWYDASHAASFSYHSGTLVSQWNDRSGNGNHLVSASSGVAPSRTGTKNGLTVVAFTNDVLTDSGGGVNSLVASVANNFTVVAVYTTSATASNFLMGSTASASNEGFGIYRDSATSIQFRARNPSSDSVRNCNVPSDDWRTIVGTVDASSTTARIPTLRSNGANSSSSETTVAAANPSGTFCVGAREASVGTVMFAGSLAELIFYNSIISSGDISSLESYLRTKWATW